MSMYKAWDAHTIWNLATRYRKSYSDPTMVSFINRYPRNFKRGSHCFLPEQDAGKFRNWYISPYQEWAYRGSMNPVIWSNNKLLYVGRVLK